VGVSDAAANAIDFGGGTGTLNAATQIRFFTAANNSTPAGTARMTIDNAGAVIIASLGGGGNQDVGADNTGKLYVPFVSDAKFKDNVMLITNALDVVRNLRGVTFDWNKKELANAGLDFGNTERSAGMIAQEVVEAVPVAASRGSKWKSYDRNAITPYLVEAIKELDTRLTRGGL